MNNSYYLLFLAALIVLELFYFWIARRAGILDHPNNRSLHEKPTIRGGGIIFAIAALLYHGITGQPETTLIVGLTMVSLVGLIDDVRSLNSSIRLLVQCLAMGWMMTGMDYSVTSEGMIALMFIVAVGTLNAFNFMDGINGMTGGYSLVALASLFYINAYQIHFIEADFLVAIILSLLVFCFFNFRTKAICFAGDVGSMSIGFIILFLLIKLITVSDNYVFIFFLSVYGVDSVLTIIQRLLRKENIFKPHKLHLFQVMVNHYAIPHVKMSLAYALLQLVINVILLLSFGLFPGSQYLIGACIILLLIATYVFTKSKLRNANQAI